MTMQKTIIAEFLAVSEKFPKNEALGVRYDSNYRAYSYDDLAKAVHSFGSFLIDQGVAVDDHCAVLLENGSDWVVADLAIAYAGAVSVPIHTTYNEHYVKHVLEHSDARYLFVSDPLLSKIEKQIDERKKIRKVFVVGGKPASDRSGFVSCGDLISYTREGIPHEFRQRSEDDVHTIVYTSGTTGVPKGAMLTNQNILSNVFGARELIVIYPNDRFFSFLPLSHILERTAGYYVPLLTGAAIYYARNSKTLSEDMKVARSTIIVSIPRVFEKAHEKIMGRFSQPLAKILFHRAMRRASHEFTGAHSVAFGFYDALLFKKIRGAFGGALRLAISGGASLPRHIAEFFKAIGILVVEGYGLTETSPILTMNTIERHKFGSVGIPLKCVEIKVSNTGEILARGDGLMKGYYKAPDMTKEHIDENGWFHTGDMGSIDGEGFLTIEGRLKEMIVLSTGRNVFPVPIEQELEESPYIEQAMVYGDNQKAIAGLIVPSFNKLHTWCEANGIPYHLPDVLKDNRIVNFYRAEIDKCLARLQHFEQLREFQLIPKEFTQDDDFLSPTLKLKRGRILKAYK